MPTVELWTYDVWGNEQDGYEVNDRSKIAEIETDIKELTSEKIAEIVGEYFYHPENITRDNNICSDNMVYLVMNDENHSDYPLGEIFLRGD